MNPGINKSLLRFSILFNLINGLLIWYALTTPGGEIGMTMYFGFPLFYFGALSILIIICIRNWKDFNHIGNWILAVLCTPIPTLIAINIVIGPFK